MHIPEIEKHHAAPRLAQLAKMYERMDRQYEAVAGQYGFRCRGCEENCCETRFYHHTLIEYFYLEHGVGKELDNGERRRLCERANAVVGAAARQTSPNRILCPLNVEGLCILYAYRPMICRLHGIPNALRKPGGAVVRSPGCNAFVRQCGEDAHVAFDRSPLYTQMAKLEMGLRMELGFFEKLKMTVAEMVVRICGEMHEIC